MNQQIEIGRLLRSGTMGFVAGCRVNQWDAPSFGALVRASLGDGYHVYGLIYDIRINDDGLVRQLVTADNVSQEVLRDNRERRILPIELSVLAVGYQYNNQIHHLLPPRPPLSLDALYLCDLVELRKFTSSGQFAYFRHALHVPDLPVAELLAAHVRQAQAAHDDDDNWMDAAIREMVALLKDDYVLLTSTLSALNNSVFHN